MLLNIGKGVIVCGIKCGLTTLTKALLALADSSTLVESF